MLDDRDLIILRQFVWPKEGDERFSSKPTVYTISKRTGYSTSTLTSRFEKLRENGFLREVYVFPTYLKDQERFFVGVCANQRDIARLLDKFSQTDFIEFFHTATVGLPVDDAFRTTDMAWMEVISRDREEAEEKIRAFLSSALGHVPRFDVHEDTANGKEEMGKMDERILDFVSYRSFWEIDPSLISRGLSIPVRSVRHSLNRLVSTRSFRLYNAISQADVRNEFVVIVLYLSEREDELEDKIGRFERNDFYRKRYILARRGLQDYLAVLKLDSLSELDETERIAMRVFGNAIIAKRFRIHFNKNLKENIARENPLSRSGPR